MTAEGAIEFEALEAQAASLMSLFGEAGYERVAPAFIQPASLFLDRIGEALRARTYVFTDPNGEELCLRPDVTIPVCRVFLERGGDGAGAKFCYNGPAFRIPEGNPDPLNPREFRQAGIEHFGEAGLDADLEVLTLTMEAVRRSGVKSFTVKAEATSACSPRCCRRCRCPNAGAPGWRTPSGAPRRSPRNSPRSRSRMPDFPCRCRRRN